MPAAAERIWLPSSHRSGAWEIPVLRVDKAVQEYDPDLRFGRNEQTGQWCIFLIRRGEAPLPVLGFEDVPHPDDALRRLHRADALRRGREILDEMNRHNDELERKENEPLERQIEAAEGEMAEVTEHLMRGVGKTRYGKSFRPRPDKMGGWS